MRQRREVSRCAYAALRRDKRCDIAVEHFAKRIDDTAHAGEPLASELARRSIIARVSATESGSPKPTAWERIN